MPTDDAGARGPFDLEGKTAVVTGAARGIGRAAASALARAGADVAGIDIAASASSRLDYAPSAPEDLLETGTLVEATGRRWLGLTVDTRDLAALRDAATTIDETFRGIDIVFANAGIQGFVPLVDMADADWHDTIDINLTGTANTLRAFGPHLIRGGGGRVIVTSSTQGQHGTLDGAAYSASKWGIIGLMKSAALEWGRYGITVNAVIPGLVDTALTRHESRYAQAIRDGGGEPTGEREADEHTASHALAARLPMGVPWVEPEDVAPVVVFLASDAARMVSGSTVAATGGDSARITP